MFQIVNRRIQIKKKNVLIIIVLSLCFEVFMAYYVTFAFKIFLGHRISHISVLLSDMQKPSDRTRNLSLVVRPFEQVHDCFRFCSNTQTHPIRIYGIPLVGYPFVMVSTVTLSRLNNICFVIRYFVIKYIIVFIIQYIIILYLCTLYIIL